ncbi:MAG: hypothetical protein AUJ75_03715 [Candidatus Omnitrophica bacterium CG1_02_49_10]|nr:MAG: hypothetical protein AUJ75_03715 [Candidatus Omnitrophica bacterium CG1_02_49_10]
MRLGVHVSIAGHIYESIDRAAALGCNTMQIFSRNPRGWEGAVFTKEDAAEFRKRKKAYDITPVLVHIPYLINLASPDNVLYKKSISAYIDDIKNADELGAEYFVTHLGSHKGSGRPAGIRRFSEAMDVIIAKAKPRLTILLEDTGGAGDSIGSRFEDMGAIMDGIKDKSKVAVCLDTCHLFVAGYDIKSKSGLDDMAAEMDKYIGLKRLKAIHLNDSMGAVSSHLDRHEHIGKGQIGSAALRRIVNHSAFKDIPMVMETPKKEPGDDIMNIAIVRKMRGGK